MLKNMKRFDLRMKDFHNIFTHLVNELYSELFDSVPSVQRDGHLGLGKGLTWTLPVFEPDLAIGLDEDAAPVGVDIMINKLDHAAVSEGGNLDLHTRVIFSSWEEI